MMDQEARNISQKALNSDLPTLSSGIAKLLFWPMVPGRCWATHTTTPHTYINESVCVCVYFSMQVTVEFTEEEPYRFFLMASILHSVSLPIVVANIA